MFLKHWFGDSQIYTQSVSGKDIFLPSGIFMSENQKSQNILENSIPNVTDQLWNVNIIGALLTNIVWLWVTRHVALFIYLDAT